MKYLLPVSFVVSLSLLIMGCSPRLVGTWKVQKYENITPGQTSVSLTNIGTMKFNKNNTGSQDLKYQMFGTPKNIVTNFDWSQGAGYINLKSSDTDFAKSWLIIEDKKNKQVWKSTDNTGRIQTMELVR